MVAYLKELLVDESMNTKHKKPPSIPQDLEAPENHIPTQVLLDIRRVAIDEARAIMGHLCFEDDQPEGLNVFFHCFPNGDMFTHSIENGYFILIALVDEKLKTLGKWSVADQVGFIETLNVTRIAMLARNGMPQEAPIKTEDNQY